VTLKPAIIPPPLSAPSQTKIYSNASSSSSERKREILPVSLYARIMRLYFGNSERDVGMVTNS